MKVDFIILRSVYASRVFLIEWLSFTRRGIERSMIAIYFLCMMAFHIAPPSGHLWFGLAVYGLVAFGMWLEHKRDNRSRIFKMMMREWVIGRISFAAFNVANSLGFLYAFPFLIALLACTGLGMWILLQYSTSLPDGDEVPGRRRKIAAAELKKLFGTSWMPAPQGQT
jgi:hypothetical protein